MNYIVEWAVPKKLTKPTEFREKISFPRFAFAMNLSPHVRSWERVSLTSLKASAKSALVGVAGVPVRPRGVGC
jgi:hypothetical protein